MDKEFLDVGEAERYEISESYHARRRCLDEDEPNHSC